MTTKTRQVIIKLLLVMLCIAMTNRNTDDLHEIRISGLAQGTTYHITYYARDSVVLKQEVDSILNEIDNSLSIYNPTSLISKFNRASDTITMDKHLQKIISASLHIYHETGGISDITVYPLVNLWGFGPEHVEGEPTDADIKAVMPCIGSGKIHASGKLLAKDLPCIKLDVNGIAQGYSVDVVAEFLEHKHIDNYLVEIGGELRVKGRKQPGDVTMKIGIEAPANTKYSAPVIRRIVDLQDASITTSGNYRKYRELNGKVVSHLINPFTGYSFQNELISVSVIAKYAITADGYDNALMGMGLQKALSFLKNHAEMQAYFIYRTSDGSIADTASTGFYRFLDRRKMTDQN